MNLFNLIFRRDRPAGIVHNLTPDEIDDNFLALATAVGGLQRKVAILVFYTSLGQGYYDGADHPAYSLATLLKNRLSIPNTTIDVYNFAKSGSQCSEALADLDANMATVPLADYDAAFAFEGHSVNEIIRNVSVATTYANIKTLHRRLQNDFAKPIQTMTVTSMTVYADTAWQGLNTGVTPAGCRAGIEEIDRLKRSGVYSELNARGYVDLSLVDDFNFQKSPTPSPTAFSSDGLHLYPAGYIEEANAILPGLTAIIGGSTYGAAVPYTSPAQTYAGMVAEETVEAESTNTSKIVFRDGQWHQASDAALSNGLGRFLNPGESGIFDVFFTGGRYLIFEGPCNADQTAQRGAFQLTLDNNAAVTTSQAYQNPAGTNDTFPYCVVDLGANADLMAHHQVTAAFTSPAGSNIYPLVDRLRCSNTLPASYGTVVSFDASPAQTYAGMVAEETVEAESTDTSKIVFRDGPWHAVSDAALSNGMGRFLNPGESGVFDVFFTGGRYLIFEGPCGAAQTAQRGPFQLTLDGGSSIAASQAFQNPTGTDDTFAYCILDLGAEADLSIHHTATAEFASPTGSGIYPLVDRLRCSNTLPDSHGTVVLAA